MDKSDSLEALDRELDMELNRDDSPYELQSVRLAGSPDARTNVRRGSDPTSPSPSSDQRVSTTNTYVENPTHVVADEDMPPEAAPDTETVDIRNTPDPTPMIYLTLIYFSLLWVVMLIFSPPLGITVPLLFIPFGVYFRWYSQHASECNLYYVLGYFLGGFVIVAAAVLLLESVVFFIYLELLKAITGFSTEDMLEEDHCNSCHLLFFVFLFFLCLAPIEETAKYLISRYLRQGRPDPMNNDSKRDNIYAMGHHVGLGIANSLYIVAIPVVSNDDSFGEVFKHALLLIFVVSIFNNAAHPLTGYLIGIMLVRNALNGRDESTRHLQTPASTIVIIPTLLRGLILFSTYSILYATSNGVGVPLSMAVSLILLGLIVVVIKRVEKDLPSAYLHRVGYLHAFGYLSLGPDQEPEEQPEDFA